MTRQLRCQNVWANTQGPAGVARELAVILSRTPDLRTDRATSMYGSGRAVPAHSPDGMRRYALWTQFGSMPFRPKDPSPQLILQPQSVSNPVPETCK